MSLLTLCNDPHILYQMFHLSDMASIYLAIVYQAEGFMSPHSTLVYPLDLRCVYGAAGLWPDSCRSAFRVAGCLMW